MSVLHERTKTSREVRVIERKLSTDLKKIANKIRKDDGFPFNVTMLVQKFGQEVQNTIQSAVQEAYQKGVEYVSQFEETAPLLTPRDIQNIEQKARAEAAGFWRAITRDTINQQVPEITRAVNVGATSNLLAIAATNGALALATIDKAQQLGDADSEVTWVTALDERVCPICRPLHRKAWKLNDPNLLFPIEDTHPNCRCRLLFRDGRELFSH